MNAAPHGKLMLTVLGGLAEFEHSLIKARTNAGRERAKAVGVRFGRKHKLDAYQRAEALKRLAAGEAMSAVAKSYRVSVPTIPLQEAAWQRFQHDLGGSWRLSAWRELSLGASPIASDGNVIAKETENISLAASGPRGSV